MALSCIISEIKRDIGRKSWLFHTPLHSAPSVGGPHRNIAIPFGTEKLEWCRCRMLKKFWGYCHPGSWLNRSDRKRGEWETTPFLFNSFISLFNSYDHAFRHGENSAFVRTFNYNVTVKPLHRVPAAFAPRDNEPARRGVAGPLSCREEQHENSITRTKQIQNENATRYNRLTYILFSYRPSAHRRLSRLHAQIPSPK